MRRFGSSIRQLLTRFARFVWSHVPRWLQNRLRPIGTYFATRFKDVSQEEGWGYAVWTVVGAAIAVPEIWAAKKGSDFIWPTISGTIGHLEDKWAIVALVPVALIAIASFAIGRFSDAVKTQVDQQVLVRTPEGRLAKAGTIDQIPGSYADVMASQGTLLAIIVRRRRRLHPGPYLVIAATLTVGASVIASTHRNKWLTGYWLYSLIALFGLMIPNALAYARRTRTDFKFMTMFATIRALQNRVHLVGVIVAAGLAILLLHLAVYPWPDLAREGAATAGFSPIQAREGATEKLQRDGVGHPNFSTQRRGVSKGRDAWFVYFLDRANRYTGCFVVVAKPPKGTAEQPTAHPAPRCRALR